MPALTTERPSLPFDFNNAQPKIKMLTLAILKRLFQALYFQKMNLAMRNHSVRVQSRTALSPSLALALLVYKVNGQLREMRCHAIVITLFSLSIGFIPRQRQLNSDAIDVKMSLKLRGKGSREGVGWLVMRLEWLRLVEFNTFF